MSEAGWAVAWFWCTGMVVGFCLGMLVGWLL
jgi:hypothetical protein